MKPILRTRIVLLILAALLALPLAPAALPVEAKKRTRTIIRTFANIETITLPAASASPVAADLYPSPITVAGMKGRIRDVNVRLNTLTHTYPHDVHVLLVGPGGATATVMAYVGGGGDVSHVTLTLDDEAPPWTQGPLLPGAYRPMNRGAGPIDFNPPAPEASANTALAVFDGATRTARGASSSRTTTGRSMPAPSGAAGPSRSRRRSRTRRSGRSGAHASPKYIGRLHSSVDARNAAGRDDGSGWREVRYASRIEPSNERGHSMEQNRFPVDSHTLTRLPSRRDVLRGLTGAGLGLAGTRLPATVAAKKKRRKKKRKQGQQRCDVCRRGCAFRGVQAAIDAAKPGDSIRLCPGTYRGKISIAKNVTLIGTGRERTILDGEGVASATAVLTIDSGATVTVRALTVTGGNGGDGGGIVNEGTVTLDGVSVSANRAIQGGGIVNRAGGTLTLTDSRVSGNKARFQGGGLAISSGEVTLNGSQVTANEAGLEQSGQGGGLFVFAGTVTLNQSPVTANKTGLNGGGLLIFNGEVRLNESHVTGNEAIEAGSQGGGFTILNGTVALDGSQVTGNTAAAGGGIYNLASDTAVTIEPESVTGNTPNNCAGKAVTNCAN